MLRSSVTHRIATFLILVFFMPVGNAWTRRPGMKVNIRFIATGTLIRGTWGRNEDVYLAELQFPKQGETVLVRLIDSYPNEWPPIPDRALKSQTGLSIRVLRDSECDLPFAHMILRTAPGDAMAMLPERLGFEPWLDRRPNPTAIIPCYRTARRP